MVDSVSTSWHDVVHVLDTSAIGDTAERGSALGGLDKGVTENNKMNESSPRPQGSKCSPSRVVAVGLDVVVLERILLRRDAVMYET